MVFFYEKPNKKPNTHPYATTSRSGAQVGEVWVRLRQGPAVCTGDHCSVGRAAVQGRASRARSVGAPAPQPGSVVGGGEVASLGRHLRWTSSAGGGSSTGQDRGHAASWSSPRIARPQPTWAALLGPAPQTRCEGGALGSPAFPQKPEQARAPGSTGDWLKECVCACVRVRAHHLFYFNDLENEPGNPGCATSFPDVCRSQVRWFSWLV